MFLQQIDLNKTRQRVKRAAPELERPRVRLSGVRQISLRPIEVAKQCLNVRGAEADFREGHHFRFSACAVATCQEGFGQEEVSDYGLGLVLDSLTSELGRAGAISPWPKTN